MSEAVVGSVAVEVVPAATNFARRLRDKLLPDADRIGTDVGRTLAERIQSALGDARVKVDTASAVADVDRIREDLKRLNGEDAAVRVKVDTGEAALEIDKVKARLDGISNKTVKVDVKTDDNGSTNDAKQGLSGLLVAGLALGPALIPVAAAAVPAIAGIGAAALGAAAGVGVLKLAFTGIGDAVNALGAQSSQTGQQLAQQAAQQLSASDSILNAQDALKAAYVGVADAHRAAALSESNAVWSVVQAEQGLGNAQYAETQAQVNLTLARKQAAQTLQDLSNQVKDGALTQRQATIDLQNAQNNLTLVDFNPHSTAQQRAEAQLAVDQAKQHIAEVVLANQRLAQTKATADKQGVANAPTVLAAQNALANATQARVNAEHQLAVAQAASIEAQRAGFEQVAKAQQQVVQSQRALALAYASAGAQGVAANTAVAQAMAKLSPAGQAFAHFVHDVLQPAFRVLTDAAQTAFLPGFQAAIQTLLPYLPAFAGFVSSIGRELATMAGAAAKALTGPFWQQFFAFLSQLAQSSLASLGSIIGNLATGFAGLFQALGPSASGIGSALVGITKAFAEWATTLTTNKGFQAFLQYIAQNASVVMDFFEKLFVIVGKLLTALAPFGSVLVTLLDGLATFLAKLTPGELLAIAYGIAAIVAVFTGGFQGIVIAIAAVTAMLSYLYTHNKLFHEFVDAIVGKVRELVGWFKQHWPEISATIKKTWDNEIEPILSKWGKLIVSLWQTIIYPVLKWIGEHWKQIAAVIAAQIHLTIGMIGLLTDIISFLWFNIVKPVLGWIGDQWDTFSKYLSQTYHDVIEPVWSAFSTAFTDVQGGFRDLYNGMESIWGDIKTLFVNGVNFVTQDVLNPFFHAINAVTGLLGIPKIPDIPKIGGSGNGGGTLGGGSATGRRDHNFADGGVVPGFAPGLDIVDAKLSPGEGVLVPEAVQALGPGFIHAVNKRFSNRTSSGNHFKGGGVVGAVEGAIGSVLGKGANTVLSIAESPVKSLINSLPSKFVRELASGGFDTLDKAIRGFIGHLTGTSAGSIVSDTTHANLIRTALGLAGVAATPGNIGDVDLIVSHESGWNPNAINLTDSNALAGHPSQGLMQTIPSTFDAYRLAALSANIDDPLSNLVAGIRYAVSRYGSLDGVPGVASVHGGGGYVGYDSGGYLPPGVTQVYNGTGKPEPVFTDAQWKTLTDSKQHGGMLAHELHVHGVEPGAVASEIVRRQAMAGKI